MAPVWAEMVVASEKLSRTSQSDQAFPGGCTQSVALRRWTRWTSVEWNQKRWGSHSGWYVESHKRLPLSLWLSQEGSRYNAWIVRRSGEAGTGGPERRHWGGRHKMEFSSRATHSKSSPQDPFGRQRLNCISRMDVIRRLY